MDTKGYALYNTIESINDGGPIISILAYSDQPPDAPVVFNKAHAKGFIAYDNSSKRAVYVVHSVP